MDRSPSLHSRHYATVANAIEYIRANVRRQPSLADVATGVGLSEHHLQRIFSEWAGISPKRFLQYLTKEYAKAALRSSKDVLGTAVEVGLSGPGRLHDLMVSCEAMSPGEIRQQGLGVKLTYGNAKTPFGNALIGWTPRGICHLAFCDGDCDSDEKELSLEWPAAKLVRDDDEASTQSDRIFSAEPEPGKLHLLLRGTNFQIKVWEALLNTGSSRVLSYHALARLAGSADAPRAVGSALAANRIAFLIPCHRVIRKNGDVGTYRWGSERKIAMLAWEATRNNQQA
ncbi:MAG: methylated-DNA--[protein]-cysteine S-methyltransferase [Thiotrichales bacterium]|nr:MAG: methylated-DNA--[protein]-cysteine S-methyltransferase [Thiotrichales bacterium]